MRLLRLLLGAALLSGCVSASLIPDDQRDQLTHDLTGKSRYLKVSMYKGPFWRDDTKTLVSDVDPTTLQYLQDTDGKVVPAGAPTGIIPVGTHVRITQVELPTAMVVAGRMVYSPRYNPWIYLAIDGEDPSKPDILVLRPGIKSKDEFMALLDRYLTADDPAPLLAPYSDEIKAAIREKRVVKDMDAAAVQMAWGYPEHEHIDVNNGRRSETWTYGEGQRSVDLVDGKVTNVKQGEATTAPAAR